MHSALYLGQLRHRRFSPREHAFTYPLFMMYIDLTELDLLFHRRWFWSARRPTLAWFRRADYLGDPTVTLDQAVRDRVELEAGVRPRGAIRMLTHLRFFGFNFNPVTFYYCFDSSDKEVETIVAEITNTPWKERHAYVLSRRTTPTESLRFVFSKKFHISPFMEMDFSYDWRFSKPGNDLSVHMENIRDGSKAFDATLSLHRREISTGALATTLLRYPCMPARVILAIYWQALKLWFKRIPFYPHPPTANDLRKLDHERHAR